MTTRTNERTYQILKAPQISEKSTLIADKSNQVVFLVERNATKPEIKVAVETAFGVKVQSVQTSVAKGKQKRFGGMLGRRSDVKKAFVCLAEGQEIDFSEGGK